jgi:hypothetical protein
MVILDSRLAAWGRVRNGIPDWPDETVVSSGEAVEELDANTLLGGKLADDEVD